MKRFRRVILWAGILFAPLLLHLIVPNLALNIVNRFGARILLTSAQLREIWSVKDSPTEAAPAIANGEVTQ
ncbi:MAG TPA: hypothetical protein VLJ37_07935 [bacterium]|nr:hypothetical protein [bacterium]